jgi:hypothetical protein
MYFFIQSKCSEPGMVAYTCDPSTQEAETRGSKNSRPAWAT